jgi:hypothetical protein
MGTGQVARTAQHQCMELWVLTAWCFMKQTGRAMQEWAVPVYLTKLSMPDLLPLRIKRQLKWHSPTSGCHSRTSAKLFCWIQRLKLALSKWSNRVGVSFPLPEEGNRSSFRNIAFSTYLEIRADKMHKPSDSECHTALSELFRFYR